MLTRRRLFHTAAGVGVATVFGDGTGCTTTRRREPGRQLGLVPFEEPTAAPLGVVVGSGLDGRLATDLSTLTPEDLITPNDRFYIRTCHPDQLDTRAEWKVAIHGLIKTRRIVTLSDLRPMVEPQGTHLMECAGNPRDLNFGLISAANWAGIPLAAVLGRVEPRSASTLVLISGFDRHSQASQHSMPGASWIFTREQLESNGAFLATEMNGRPLSPDHGSPLRLVMPGWYGCTCIKWVDEIALVGETAPATSQMREFAQRTHQTGVPALARDFQPATIDLAAMPVRVEMWWIDEAIWYRVVGILWGGTRRTDALVIRFNPNTEDVPVESCRHQTNASWTVWNHFWRPKVPGKYWIQLRIADSRVRSRRLQRGYYSRKVIIKHV
jgi:DMSO/TMAO reductase YedYZ molybdopterin-dependent catalytic subunit